jgi:hypothetical protein
MYVDVLVAQEPRPSAKVCTSMSCTQSLAIHDSRHTAGTVSAQWGPKCHVKARRPVGTSMQREQLPIQVVMCICPAIPNPCVVQQHLAVADTERFARSAEARSTSGLD